MELVNVLVDRIIGLTKQLDEANKRMIFCVPRVTMTLQRTDALGAIPR